MAAPDDYFGVGDVVLGGEDEGGNIMAVVGGNGEPLVLILADAVLPVEADVDVELLEEASAGWCRVHSVVRVMDWHRLFVPQGAGVAYGVENFLASEELYSLVVSKRLSSLEGCNDLGA